MGSSEFMGCGRVCECEDELTNTFNFSSPPSPSFPSLPIASLLNLRPRQPPTRLPPLLPLHHLVYLLGLGDLHDDPPDGPSTLPGRLSRGAALWGVCAVERIWGEEVRGKRRKSRVGNRRRGGQATVGRNRSWSGQHRPRARDRGT